MVHADPRLKILSFPPFSSTPSARPPLSPSLPAPVAPAQSFLTAASRSPEKNTTPLWLSPPTFFLSSPFHLSVYSASPSPSAFFPTIHDFARNSERKREKHGEITKSEGRGWMRGETGEEKFTGYRRHESCRGIIGFVPRITSCAWAKGAEGGGGGGERNHKQEPPESWRTSWIDIAAALSRLLFFFFFANLPPSRSSLATQVCLPRDAPLSRGF